MEKERIEQIKEHSNKTRKCPVCNRTAMDFVISRLAENTKKRFKEIASQEDFCQDYGNALKFLIDFHDGIIIHGNEQILEELHNLRQDINIIKKEVFKEEKKPVRRMMNGKPLF